MTVISIENVSKSYRLGMIGGFTLQDDIARAWAKLRGRSDPLEKVGSQQRAGQTREKFWALRDVSFQVQEGEVLGIIGRNGAGKSTLLKILSQVTTPTGGRIRLKGRIASLLEVGTGFHPELTGRENVVLNGAILGMGKREIRAKMDEIVAFSGVEPFIDTPVKRYSSGMKVRLAFAVAAHLEPEILVIDEVLAVGDAAFQKKCLGKMSDAARSGRTILFVSHDLGNVSRLCERGVLLEKGRVEAAGPITSVIAAYTAGNTQGSDGFADLRRRADRTGSGDVQFQSMELVGLSGSRALVEFGSALTGRLRVDVHRDVGAVQLVLTISTGEGTPVYELYECDGGSSWRAAVGAHLLTVCIPRLRLYPGDYVVDLWAGDFQNRRLDYVKEALRFQVVQTSSASLERTLDRRWAMVFEASEWSHSASTGDGVSDNAR